MLGNPARLAMDEMRHDAVLRVIGYSLLACLALALVRTGGHVINDSFYGSNSNRTAGFFWGFFAAQTIWGAVAIRHFARGHRFRPVMMLASIGVGALATAMIVSSPDPSGIPWAKQLFGIVFGAALTQYALLYVAERTPKKKGA